MDTNLNPISTRKDYLRMIFIFLAIVLLVMAGVIAWELYKESLLSQQAVELRQEVNRITNKQ